MNTLELLKVSRRKQNTPLLGSSTPQHSKVVPRKHPQSRLSYLKKLFAKNMSTQNETQNIEEDHIQKEKKAFARSNVTVNSSKNLGKMHLKQVPKNNMIQSKQPSRFASMHQSKFLPQNKLQICPKSTDLKISAQPHLLNEPVLLNKTKFVQRHRKISSEGYQAHSLNSSNIQSYGQSPCQYKRKIVNRSCIEPQKQKGYLVKKEIKQLRKIGRMLDEIKCEILKNRSVIIEGIKQIKCAESIKINKKNQLLTSVVGDFNTLRMKQYLYERQSDLPESSPTSMKDFNRHKPKVQYPNVFKIR